MSYKKWICGVWILIMGCMLSGCCNHTYYEATCTSPMVCSKCGKTSGEIKEHDFAEANYQQPETCTGCGLTQGEVLQPDFEKYGIVCDAKEDVEYPFVNKCVDNGETTVGKIMFSDYDVFLSDDGYEERDGYEWRTVTCTLTFDDENANEYGVANYAYSISDYYDVKSANESWSNDIFTVNFNGKDYTQSMYTCEVLQDEWVEDALIIKLKFCINVPAGYDGVVVWLCDSETREFYEEYMNVEEELEVLQSEGTMLFRMK
ncbi:MAG: hypothetical protein K2N55_10885 [Lachnospiraceae bacterium]|nr:hypothetical protein [Lachnospiraceae bacterium]